MAPMAPMIQYVGYYHPPSLQYLSETAPQLVSEVTHVSLGAKVTLARSHGFTFARPR